MTTGVRDYLDKKLILKATDVCAAEGKTDEPPVLINRREFVVAAACGLGLVVIPMLTGCKISFSNEQPSDPAPSKLQEQDVNEKQLESTVQEDKPAPGNASQDSGRVLESPAVGSSYQFGDLSWRVLDVRDGRVLLITEDIVEMRAYNDDFVSITWEGCSLRAYLNGGFLGKHFNDGEQGRIMLSDVRNDDNPEWGTPGGNDTQDKLFLLSIGEARNYFADNAARAAKYQGSGSWWWLRSPGSIAYSAAYVRSNGRVDAGGGSVNSDYNGVRPALWLNL